MDTKLTKQSEAILDKLEHKISHRLFSEDEMKRIRMGLALVDSYGVFSRFIVGLAATITAILVILKLWPNNGGQQ